MVFAGFTKYTYNGRRRNQARAQPRCPVFFTVSGMANTKDELIDMKEAARMLGVYPDTVKRWLKLNHLRGRTTPLGRSKIYRSSVERLLKQMETGNYPKDK